MRFLSTALKENFELKYIYYIQVYINIKFSNIFFEQERTIKASSQVKTRKKIFVENFIL